MKITIKEIAEKAGVSNAAVSLALNNKQGVSEDNRERILQIAKDLGYELLSRTETAEPDITIRFLKISRHGHTLNPSHNYFIDTYVEGITSTAYRNGAVLEIEAYGAGVPLENITNKIINSPQITGYLILGTELNESDVNAFLKTGKKIVFMDTFIDYISADFVDMNNTDAVYKIIRHFTSRGHSRIGLIKSSVNTRNFYLRERAFYQAMNSMNLEINENFIIDVDSTFENAYSDFKNFLSEKPELPSVFFAINDIIAMGCMRALQEAGYSVPDDVSIAAFDNLPMAAMVSPQLTTIEVSKQDIGQTAFDMLLLKCGRKDSPPPRKTQIGGKLIIRDSVKDLM
ncbi:MAG: LacI family DNA-binding transcriptional regulator [Spirochaetales bacterium]|nr:LacI family DNA-binding transcriptional regulator [Spirochaetales bacterium]